jgi:hypothetical protein
MSEVGNLLPVSTKLATPRMIRTIPKRTVIFAISIFPIGLVQKDGVYAAFYQEKLHSAASNKYKAIGKMLFTSGYLREA